jgi:hypothetical protein
MKLSVSLQSLDLGQSTGFLEEVASLSQALYLYTNTEKRTHNTTLNIHALIGIRTHGPGVCANEKSSFPKPVGYRDGHFQFRATFLLYKPRINTKVFCLPPPIIVSPYTIWSPRPSYRKSYLKLTWPRTVCVHECSHGNLFREDHCSFYELLYKALSSQQYSAEW